VQPFRPDRAALICEGAGARRSLLFCCFPSNKVLRYSAGMDAEEKIKVLLEHPDESPEIIGMLDYLIDPPSRLASTARWVKFRGDMAQAVADRPDDQHFPLFLAQAEKILAWRATIAPERRIWKTD
jgi:hypothetical protein